MSSIIHCQEKLINSTLMKTWAIFYFAAEKSRISICCLVMCWFSPLGCVTDVHHICRYLKYLLSSTTFVLSKHHRVGGTFLMMTAMKIQKKKNDWKLLNILMFYGSCYLRWIWQHTNKQTKDVSKHWQFWWFPRVTDLLHSPKSLSSYGYQTEKSMLKRHTVHT